MNIGIIGAGGIGLLYARLWSARGHKVMLSSRNPEGIAGEAEKIGATVGTPAQAADFGDAVLLAVNYWTLDEALEAIEPGVQGKLVIDATNPLQHTKDGGVERVIADDLVAGLVMAEKLPGARVAKAFTTLWTGHVESHANLEAPTVAMPFATDDSKGRTVVSQLIRDAGLVPVDLGPLSRSRPLDPPSPIWNVVLTPAELRARIG